MGYQLEHVFFGGQTVYNCSPKIKKLIDELVPISSQMVAMVFHDQMYTTKSLFNMRPKVGQQNANFRIDFPVIIYLQKY